MPDYQEALKLAAEVHAHRADDCGRLARQVLSALGDVGEAQPGAVYVKLIRPEGYEDVHPEVLLVDANINPAFEPELVAAHPPAPQGMVMVPKEPTSEMLKKGEFSANMNHQLAPELVAKYVYAAMLEAAPSAGRGTFNAMLRRWHDFWEDYSSRPEHLQDEEGADAILAEWRAMLSAASPSTGDGGKG